MRRKPRVGLGVLVGLLMAMMTCLAASIIYLVRGPEAFAATPLYLGIALLVGEAVSAGVIGAVLVGGAVGYKLLPPPTKGVRSSPDAYTQQDP
jgi:hypothetical protein